MGKTTLMKFIAEKRLPVPAHLRVLLVDQEVPSTEASCVESVLEKDVIRTQLLEREAELVAQVEAEDAAGRDASWWAVGSEHSLYSSCLTNECRRQPATSSSKFQSRSKHEVATVLRVRYGGSWQGLDL